MFISQLVLAGNESLNWNRERVTAGGNAPRGGLGFTGPDAPPLSRGGGWWTGGG